MLVLSRKIGQKIIVAGNIEITVVAVHGNKIRIGVSAPDDVSINRAEVQRKIDAAKTSQ